MFPKYFEIETVNACNARCTMCTINEWTKGTNVIMPMGLIEKLADEIAPHANWVEHVCLNRDGEPTLDKALARRVELLKHAGVRRVTFATNGQLMNEPFVVDMCAVGLDDIMVSIDGATKETFEKIRVRLDFDTVVNNTLQLKAIRDECLPSMTIGVRAVIMPENEHEIDDLLAFWKSALSPQDRVYAMPMHSWGNQHFKENAVKVEHYAEVPCVSPFSTMVIDVDGQVPLCGCDYDAKKLLGDFSKQTITDIWNGPEYTEVRHLHSTGNRNDIWLCQGCDLWERNKEGV